MSNATTYPVTAKALTVVDKSTKALVAASAGVVKVIQDLNEAASIAANLAQDIEFKESNLIALTGQFATKERELQAELKLRVLENGTTVLQTLLKERGLVSITPVELSTLQDQLKAAETSNEQAVSQAVAAISKELTTEAAAKLNAVQSEHKVAIATINANSESQKQTNVFLTKQVADLQAQIVAEREARIAIAEAEAGKQGVTVNTGK